MTVVAATDFSRNSAQALAQATKLARVLETNLVVVHVIDALEDSAWMILVEDPGELERHVRTEREARLQAFYREHVDERVEDVKLRVEVGRVTDVLLRVREEEGADTLVVGAQGRGPLASMILGSATHRLLRRAPCPVLVVPSQDS